MQKIYLKKYDSKDTYMSPSGMVMDADEVKKEFPASSMFTFVVQTDEYGQMMYGMYNLASMKSKYGVSSSLGDDEAVVTLQNAMNSEQEELAIAAENPTPEERIAAMLEYQALTSLEDTEV